MIFSVSENIHKQALFLIENAIEKKQHFQEKIYICKKYIIIEYVLVSGNSLNERRLIKLQKKYESKRNQSR